VEETEIDFDRTRDGFILLERGELEDELKNVANTDDDDDDEDPEVELDSDVDDVELDDFSFGIMNGIEDSLLLLFLRKDKAISVCLRFEVEPGILGGGITGIGDLVDKVLK